MRNVHDTSFSEFGKVHDKRNFEDIYNRLQTIPYSEEIVYVGSELRLEKSFCKSYIEELVFGTMPIQIGYCNGHNYQLNALEFHKSSEVIVAGTDLILILGNTFDIKDHQYDTSKASVFTMKAGEVVEIFSNCLHYCPISMNEHGFNAAIILPRFTNDELEQPSKGLFARNKWLLGHSEAFDLKKPHLYGQLVGENITLGGSDNEV